MMLLGVWSKVTAWGNSFHALAHWRIRVTTGMKEKNEGLLLMKRVPVMASIRDGGRRKYPVVRGRRIKHTNETGLADSVGLA